MTDTITVYSDYVCPFCYLGQESLSRYRERRADPLTIAWRPFDLRAGKRNADGTIDHDVDDGKDEDYYTAARENVRRLQERYGVEMAQEIALEIDSLPAQLVSLGIQESYPTAWEAFDRAVFVALWENGLDIGDRSVLRTLADDVDGIDGDFVDAALADEDRRARLEAAFDDARQRGVTGVPTFIYDGHAAQGAVPPEHLERLVEGV